MSLPPGPSSPPIYQIARWIARPLPMLDECQRTYGDVFTMITEQFHRMTDEEWREQVGKKMIGTPPWLESLVGR